MKAAQLRPLAGAERGRRPLPLVVQVQGTLLLLGLVLTALPACSVLPSEEPPVADSTLVEVLVDLHLATSYARIEGSEFTPAQREAILERHGLSRRQFERAMAYHLEHPNGYLALYDRVLDRLNTERTSMPP